MIAKCYISADRLTKGNNRRQAAGGRPQATGCGHVIFSTVVPLYQKCSHQINQWKSKVIIIHIEGARQNPISINFPPNMELIQTYLIALIFDNSTKGVRPDRVSPNVKANVNHSIDICLTLIAIFRYLPTYDSTQCRALLKAHFTNLIAVDLWYLRALETLSAAKYQLIHLLLSLILMKHTSVI